MKKNILLLVSMLQICNTFGKTTEITSLAQLEDLKNKNPHLVLKFHATWCPACNDIKPLFDTVANKAEFDHILFADIDVDKNRDASSKYEVSSIPAFIYIKDQKEVDKEVGGRKDFEVYISKKLTDLFPRQAETAQAKPEQTDTTQTDITQADTTTEKPQATPVEPTEQKSSCSICNAVTDFFKNMYNKIKAAIYG